MGDALRDDAVIHFLIGDMGVHIRVRGLLLIRRDEKVQRPLSRLFVGLHIVIVIYGLPLGGIVVVLPGVHLVLYDDDQLVALPIYVNGTLFPLMGRIFFRAEFHVIQIPPIDVPEREAALRILDHIDVQQPRQGKMSQPKGGMGVQEPCHKGAVPVLRVGLPYDGEDIRLLLAEFQVLEPGIRDQSFKLRIGNQLFPPYSNSR